MTIPRSRLLALAAALVLAAGVLGVVHVTGDDDRARRTTKAAAATLAASDAPGGRRPAASAQAAVEQLLTAEQAGKHEQSFHLLSTATLKAYPDVEIWADRRTELPSITGFRVTGVDGKVVSVLVDHVPGVDRFVGLRAAHDVQRWHVRQEAGGWLVDGDPEIAPQLPDVGPARDVAQRWAQAVQRCDQGAAEALQVEPSLAGVSAAAAGVCGSTATITTEAPGKVPPGPGSADLVAQYGQEALTWARRVVVRAGDVEMAVLLAPIGSDWRVASVTDR
jgi:hypothetical protein